MRKTLKQIQEGQKEFQRMVDYPIDSITAKDRNEMAEKYLFKMIEEVVELRKEFPSVMNPWSKSQKNEDTTRIKEELSDIFLFLINFVNIWRFTEEELLEVLSGVQERNFIHVKKKKMGVVNAEMMKVPEPVMAGNGHMTPHLVFVGQNPGQGLERSHIMELEMAEPKPTSFGLLMDILKEEGMHGWSYYTNLVKVKTEGNDNPSEELTSFWAEFFLKELDVLQYNNPDMKIVAMGNWTFEQLDNILKGTNYHDKLIKITHPSFVMRSGTQEKYAEEIRKIL